MAWRVPVGAPVQCGVLVCFPYGCSQPLSSGRCTMLSNRGLHHMVSADREGPWARLWWSSWERGLEAL